jgi:hypothetical protein
MIYQLKNDPVFSGELVKCLEQARALLISKVDPGSNRDPIDVTAEMDRLTKRALSKFTLTILKT